MDPIQTLRNVDPSNQDKAAAEARPLPRERRSLGAALLPLALRREDGSSLQRQLYDQLREAILGGRLAPRSRLPSTRALASELGCARNTVAGAYDQLLAEGYLEARSGSGTFVSGVLPESLLGTGGKAGPPRSESATAEGTLSRRGSALAELRRGRETGPGPFRMGLPETGEFPFEIWARLLQKVWRQPAQQLVRHGQPAGYAPLRGAIAGYLRTVRALDCQADQVIITSGAQQSVDLAVRALTDPGDRVWLEDPGYTGLRGPLIAAGADLVPLPLDGEGLSLSAGLARAPDARMVIVTPSHHYPLGTVMSLARRLAFIDWAREREAWILEDDYDSEYRYAGQPLAALQGLDGAGRVLYIGSFSKVLFPSIRLGYLVVPPGLVARFTTIRAALDDHPSAMIQPVLARFIEEGHFAAHIRRMRRLYAERQAALVAAGRRHLQGLLELAPDEAGLHLVAPLAPELAARMDDRAAAARARAAGIVVHALSDFYLAAKGLGGRAATPRRRQALLLGYAAVPVGAVEPAVRRLAAALSD